MVFREGEMASQCFVVAQGEMAQSKEGRVMRTLGAFSSFGEQELLSQLPRNFSVSCKTAHLACFFARRGTAAWTAIAMLSTWVEAVEVSPIVFSGTINPRLNLTVSQTEVLRRKMGRYAKPGPRTRTVGYRGFRLGEDILRGCKEAEVYLLDLFRPHLPAVVLDHMEQEISADHVGELDLPDRSFVPDSGANCSHEVGPDSVPIYDPQKLGRECQLRALPLRARKDDAGCFVTHQSENNCYNYATDISTETRQKSCEEAVRVAAESDGLQWAGTTLPTAAPKRGHYVALFIWPDTNFHWIRMDRTGYWSHKPGGTPDNKGQKIHDPSKSDFSPWTQFCGYMHVIPSAVSPEGEGRDLLQDQLQLRRVDIHLDDLQEISTLGYGTYGIVRLVEHQSTGARYALKCISRNEAVARRQQASICAEREILTDVDHPFILKLVRTFKDHRRRARDLDRTTATRGRGLFDACFVEPLWPEPLSVWKNMAPHAASGLPAAQEALRDWTPRRRRLLELLLQEEAETWR
eukprot:g4585.t1